jgi:energy-coupling factor transport system ATP-binding protein
METRPPGAPPILQVHGLAFTYPGQASPALRGIDLSIGEGEFVAILGQNGSGKSTLAKQFNGLLKPTSGAVRVGGRSAAEMGHREMAERVGYVFQNPDHQIFARTVGEEVGFSLKVLGKGAGVTAQRVAEALEVVGLQGRQDALPFSLTKGERQRVAVASVLAARPQVLVLDEPTTGLDYPQQRAMMEMLRQLNGKGHTVIVITHAMWVAEQYAHRTVVLQGGRLLLDGPTRDVFRAEELLARAGLRPSQTALLSNWLGARALTLEGLVRELGG